jgi:hypothetical protein
MQNGNFKDQDLKAPPRLVAALQKASKTEIFIPPTIDEAIACSARRHLLKLDRKRSYWLRLFVWGSAPVTLLAIFLLLHHSPVGFAREDLNHDGKVDILDAFALARELRSPGKFDRAKDINGDGVLDQRDIEQLAVDAVRLAKGHRS